MSAYDGEEVVWKLEKRYHAGIILRAETHEHLLELMDSYTPSGSGKTFMRRCRWGTSLLPDGRK